MLSCEFSEIFKNNFIYKTPMVAGFFKYVFLSTVTLKFLFHFRGRRRLKFNSVLFTQEILNEIILLYMDYDVAVGLKRNK